jgi:hypothetical protein
MPLEKLPFTPSQLEAYRLQTRPQLKPGLVGGHQMRRKGQSLEFRDFRPYVPGDDIRHLDWRASSFHGGPNDWLVRDFEAEERLTLIISVDTGDTMNFPDKMPKMLIASWLAEAITWISLRSGDRVILHWLFGPQREDSRVELSGNVDLLEIHGILEHFTDSNDHIQQPNLEVIEGDLKPATVWLVISDYYFDWLSKGETLAMRMVSAQEGWRWIITVDMDSWPYEKNLLGLGARKIEGPGNRAGELPVEVDQEGLRRIEDRIDNNRSNFLESVSCGAHDHVQWKWPEGLVTKPADFFNRQFPDDHILRQLFMRGSQP